MAKKPANRKPSAKSGPSAGVLAPLSTGKSGRASEAKEKGSQGMTLTAERADALCEFIEQGGSLRGFCAIEGNPCKTTVLKWLRTNAAFAAQYASARARQMDHYAEEILEIADDNTNDIEEVEIAEGVKVTRTNHDVINRAKLRIDTRRWLMGKLAPKKYGDKLDVTTDGKKLDGNTLHITREVIGGK